MCVKNFSLLHSKFLKEREHILTNSAKFLANNLEYIQSNLLVLLI